MTVTLNLSLQEEKIVKNVTELAQRGRKDPDLSACIIQYMDLIMGMTFEDALDAFNINFVKAAVFIESVCKIYSIKVDNVGSLLDELLDTLINKHCKKKGGDSNEGAGDDDRQNESTGDADVAPVQNRRRRRIKDVVADEDFFDSDNKTGLAGKCCNEADSAKDFILRFLERNMNLFNTSAQERKRIDVCLKKSEDKDESRLRDWLLNRDMMLVREVFTADGMSDESRFFESMVDMGLAGCDDRFPEDVISEAGDWAAGGISAPSTPGPMSDGDGGYNEGYSSGSEASIRVAHVRTSPPPDLVDLPSDKDEKLDGAIASKKLKPGNTIKQMCEVCPVKRKHKENGKNCKGKLESIEKYFRPHVQPLVQESPYGLLPDKQLYGLYKAQMKIVQNSKRRPAKEISKEPQPPTDVPFAGFDEDEDEILQRGLDEDVSGVLDNDFELPLPIVDSLSADAQDDVRSVASSDRAFERELREINNAQKYFERNKQIGLRVTAWHRSLSEKINLSEERGALNMDIMASKIMHKFPAGDRPTLPFHQLVRGHCRRDVPRFFLTCLQLTNEGNIDIEKTSKGTDGIVLRRLRSTRVKELDDYNPDNQQPGSPRLKNKTKRIHGEMDGNNYANGQGSKRSCPLAEGGRKNKAGRPAPKKQRPAF